MDNASIPLNFTEFKLLPNEIDLDLIHLHIEQNMISQWKMKCRIQLHYQVHILD